MSAENDLASQGIAAFKAGNKKEAAKLLAEAVKEDRENDEAWFTLAQLVKDKEKRKQCLEMALKINPDYTEAKTQLEQLENQSLPKNASTAPKIKNMGGNSIMSPKLLTSIPGAPENISLAYLLDYEKTMAQDSLSVMMGKTESLKNDEATWWNVFLPVALVSFLTGLAFTIQLLIRMVRYDFFDPPIIRYFYYPIVVVFVGLAAFGAGCVISHWYATKQENGSATLLNHAHTLVKIWTPAAILLAILAVISGILANGDGYTLSNVFFNGFYSLDSEEMILTIIAAVIAVYTLFLLSRAIATAHGISMRGALITAIIMLAVTSLVFP
jgi:hypothetical protein